ncbi:MAG: hypothetical protein ABI837_18730, partial [Acidobacteriota bacterium]
SRMREIRQSGSEGGGGREASPYPYFCVGAPRLFVAALEMRGMRQYAERFGPHPLRVALRLFAS